MRDSFIPFSAEAAEWVGPQSYFCLKKVKVGQHRSPVYWQAIEKPRGAVYNLYRRKTQARDGHGTSPGTTNNTERSKLKQDSRNQTELGKKKSRQDYLLIQIQIPKAITERRRTRNQKRNNANITKILTKPLTDSHCGLTKILKRQPTTNPE